MPVFKTISIYEDSTTRLRWTLTAHRADADEAASVAAFGTWWDSYKFLVPAKVSVVGLRISNVDVYRDMYSTTGDFYDPGAQAGECTEIASYLNLKGNGTAANKSFSCWKLHGIASALVTGSSFSGDPALINNACTAALAYFKQYRKVGTLHVPIVNPPAAFRQFTMERRLYVRRLGRPLTYAGQQHSYLRTA